MVKKWIFYTLQHLDVLSLFMGQGILRVMPPIMHLSVHCLSENDGGHPIFIEGDSTFEVS
jgi:hypothetical protein